jgi:YidC/Oxa1 family membrane protein insertase
MDMKRTVVGTALALALFAGWFLLVGYIDRTYGPQPQPGAANTPPAAPAAGATQPATNASATTIGPAPAPGAAPTTGLQILEAGTTPEVARLGSDARAHPQYALQLNTSPTGAGVQSVVLNDFLASVDDPQKRPYTFQRADPAVESAFGQSLASRAVTVDGQTVDVSKALWKLEGEPHPGAATYSLTLGTPGKPVLKVLKTYRVFERASTEHPGLGYEVRVDYDLENHAGRPLTVSFAYNGPTLPPRELDVGPDQRVMGGYHYPGAANVAVENYYVESFTDGNAVRELTAHADNVPLFWVGGSSVYFDAIALPPLQADGKTSSLRSVKAHGMAPGADDLSHQPVALTVETAEVEIPAGKRYNYPLHVYFGPKARKVLSTPYYAALPRDYDTAMVVRAGPCGTYCTFDWLINLLVIMLGAFQMVLRDWGLAIIALVVLVRLLLHPISKRSQISMLKMGKMGPEMQRLREKHGNNKEELQKAMWEFQKQQGFTPILGCLPMFLQMPIWIALWSALSTTFELRHSAFLWGFTWIDDLAKPDRLIPFGAYAFRLPLIGMIDAFNVLPILLAFVFFLQQKYTPKPPAMTPEQQQQQKMMQWMVLIFPLFLYGQPSGLNLYILASTGIGIWESKRIRRHIKEKEEAEKAGVVIVDAPPPDRQDRPSGGGGGGKGKGKRGKQGGPPAAPAAKATPGGWLARKLAELQEKAEQVRREAERGKGR